MSKHDDAQAASFVEALRLYREHPEFGCPYAMGNMLVYYFHGDDAEAQREALFATVFPGVTDWTVTRTFYATTYRARTPAGFKVHVHAERS